MKKMTGTAESCSGFLFSGTGSAMRQNSTRIYLQMSCFFVTKIQKPLNFNGYGAIGIKFRKFEISTNALLFLDYIV